MPTYDAGRIRHAADLMHYSVASNSSSIPSNWKLSATGDSGVTWTPSDAAGAVAASAVTLADAGGYWTSTDVEAWSQELGKLVDGVSVHGNTGSTETFDAATVVHTATLDANCTFTLTALASGLLSSLELWLTQDGTGGRTITLPASVTNKTALQTAQVTTLSTLSILILESTDGGSTWIGFWAGGAPAITAAAVTALGFVGPILMTDGITNPPEPLWTEDGTDYLYQDL